MFRSLWSLVLAMAMAACASGRSEQRPVSEAPAPPPVAAPSSGTEVAAPGTAVPPGTANEQLKKDAEDALSRTQARLDEATREQQFARSELDGSRQDLQRAQQEADAASRSDDALARARAAEAVDAATARSRVAEAHAEFAQRLVAARTADVEAARAHVAVVDVQVAPSTDPSHAARLAEATRVEDEARSRALELGQAALAAERQWHALAQTTANRDSAEARAPTPSATESGTGSSATGGTSESSGAPVPEPAPKW